MMRVENREVASVFYEMADLLQIAGGNRYRVRAFRRSGRIIENLPEQVNVMIRFGTFQKIPNVGPGTVFRAKQILRTGTCDDHRKLKTMLPTGLRDLLEVKGVGARTARMLYQNLRIGSVTELERACYSGKLLELPRVGEGTVSRILKGIQAWKKRIGRLPYIEARRNGMNLVNALKDMPAVHRIQLTGSCRRGKATVGDMDILVGAEERLSVTSRFVSLPWVEDILIHGEGRAQIRMRNRQQVDLRVLDPETFGAGLHYFTGAKLHNIAIRARGNRLKLKISDKGIFRRSDELRLAPGHHEEEIFAAVGLPWIPPEMRENLGEIELAAAGRLPRLVSARDLRGDLHLHTIASDGTGTAEDMIDAARALGHEYIAITDHTKSCDVANGQDEMRLAAQLHHLRDLQQHIGDMRVFAGVEVDILPDGSLDIDPSLLRQLDWVIASVHSAFDMSGREMTERLIKAMESGVVDCIGHPSGRRLGHRQGARLDLDRLFDRARKLDVAIEINGNPYRMDLADVDSRRCKEAGVMIAINTDAHSPDHMSRQEFGVITARRGWVEPRHVINTRKAHVIEQHRRDRFRRNHIQVPEGYGFDMDDVEIEEDAGPDPAEVAALVTTLGARPVSDAIKARIQKWMADGDDAVLEEALGENAMQAAFELLLS